MKDFFSNLDGNKIFWIAVVLSTLCGMPLIAVILLAIKFCSKKKG